jgi:phosphate transport system permease protein
MSAVPDSLRQAAYGMGSTKFHVTVKVVIPAAFSGIVASFVLAFSRAIGETMAVTIAAGQTPRMLNPLDLEGMLLKPIETMTAAMVNLGMSDVTGDSLAYRSLFAVGLVLFVITFIMNIAGAYISSRYKEKYE